MAHYIEGDSERVARWYKPTLRMDGSEVEIGTSDKGGPCGVWVDSENGNAPTIEVNSYEFVEKKQSNSCPIVLSTMH